MWGSSIKNNKGRGRAQATAMYRRPAELQPFVQGLNEGEITVWSWHDTPVSGQRAPSRRLRCDTDRTD
jgi:hypothetical protein